MKCECCKIDIEKCGNQKFCGNCSLYTGKLRRAAIAAKFELRRIKKELFGHVNRRQAVEVRRENGKKKRTHRKCDDKYFDELPVTHCPLKTKQDEKDS